MSLVPLRADGSILAPRWARNRPLLVSYRSMVGMQEELLACPADMILLGGARGGGKTQACLRGDWMYHMAILGGRARGLVVRDKLKYVQTARKEIAPFYSQFGGYWRGQDPGQFIFPNGAVQMWGFIDKATDAEHWKGSNLTWILVEEASLIRSQDAVLQLFALLRGDVKEKRFLLTTNPDGPGLMWVKTMFIEDVQAKSERTQGRMGMTSGNMGRRLVRTALPMPDGETKHVSRIFLPSTVHDNYLLEQRDPGYVSKLYFSTQGNEARQRAWVYGDWDSFDQQFFSNWGRWRGAGGICPVFPVPEEWPRWIGFDAGFATPFCFLWAAGVPHDVQLAPRARRDGTMGPGQIIPKNSIVLYREWYGVAYNETGRPIPNRGLRYSSEQLGATMARMRMHDPDPVCGIADPASWRMDSRIGPNLMHQMQRAEQQFWAKHRSNRPTVSWVQADNTRTSQQGFVGWEAVRHRMEPRGPRGLPYLYVMLDRCPHLLRTMPYLEHDPDKPEDLRKGGEDHAADVVRYLCSMLPLYRDFELQAGQEHPLSRTMSNGGLTMDDLLKSHNRRTGEKIPRLHQDMGPELVADPPLTSSAWCDYGNAGVSSTEDGWSHGDTTSPHRI